MYVALHEALSRFALLFTLVKLLVKEMYEKIDIDLDAFKQLCYSNALIL